MSKDALVVLAALLCMALPPQPASGQNSPSAPAGGARQSPGQDMQDRLRQIDQMVGERMDALNIPAYCLTVIKDGQVVFQKAYGFADVAHQVPATSDTVFGLASLTKTFTALTLLSLVDRGLIGLDDPLSKYVGGLTRPYQALTIRQLASMAAGVPEKLAQEVFWDEQMDILDHTPLASQPGSQFLYSNYSYRLLGTVIANVTRRDYFDVVAQTILVPLQMTSTGTTTLLAGSGRLAQAYGDDQGRSPLHAIEYKDPRISYAAGMLASTQNDMTRYVLALLSRRLLSEAGYRTLWYDRPPLTTGAPCPWAFGWKSGPNASFAGALSVAMNGGTPGVASTIIIIPEQNSAVIALANLRKPPVYAIARTAAKMAFADMGAADIQEEAADSGAD